MVDVADEPPPAALGARTSERFAGVTAKLAQADAYTVVTCEYNHSYPGTLKNLIDTHFYEWRAKPVAFVSYGGCRAGCGPSSTCGASSPSCTRSRSGTR
ncbi:NADPH-dependent FMN reductase [Actinomadura madurae]|uniref:NADPH-dependent FMN reductase n=1 Tax=Actinomadura madurae TaxID=1993 RepID=UPI0027E218D5|nr:NAD(P)H-dependent oxidoreductase [Actinomadura madurae]